jgi:8-oxo-dGTP pyrophosphatase MutT (NUDIX family)
MAATKYPISQYTCEEFVESAGIILFDLESRPLKVCLTRSTRSNEWRFAKGRRDCGESRHETALREAYEETGYRGRLLPVTMSIRAPAVTEEIEVQDKPRRYTDLTEPFMVTVRHLGASNVKFIYWFIAALDQKERGRGEPDYVAEFFPWEEAMEELTYQTDRDILRRAIFIMKESYPSALEEGPV